MKTDITEIVTALLSLCAALITGFAVPWLREKLGAARLERLAGLARVAVEAAEQIYGSGEGEKKRAYAIAWLGERGFSVDEAQLEAAVYRLREGGSN